MKDSDIILLLFDVDGVIVEPLAYKEGIIKSMEILCAEIGLDNPKSFAPSHAEIAYYESRGVHDVWDMCNMMFGLVLSKVFQILHEQPDLNSYETQPCLEEIKTYAPKIERPDFNKFIDQLQTMHSTMHPPDLALAFLSAETEKSNCRILLSKFLHSTRSAYDSYGTRIFQNVILGSEEFEKTYGLKSEYMGPSLLKTIDKVLMNSESASSLMQLKSNPKYRIGIYTARPSHAPSDISQQEGYSPEAEIATLAAGLSSVPLVGMGMMEWLAVQHKERTEDLTKPNTAHSLSAILSALVQKNDSATLERAYQFDKRKHSTEPLRIEELENRNIHAFVFEDTSSGIKPMKKNAETLRSLGYQISVSPLGIATDQNKKEALSHICDHVFSDVNQALRYALSESINGT